MADAAYLDELIALDAAGALEADERRAVRELLAGAPPHVAREARDLYETAAALALGAAQPVEPPASVRARIIAKATRAAAALPTGLSIIRAKEGWMNHPTIAGLRMKVLAHDAAGDRVTLLINADPGVRYPAHRHTAPEECYVLEGDLQVGDHVLGPGDFHHADPDTDHVELYTKTGVTVLLFAGAADYLSV